MNVILFFVGVMMLMCDMFVIFIIVDYDYEFYGYSDYRGGYNDPYYDEYYRNYDGGEYYDYFPSSGATTAAAGGVPQRTTRTNNSVGP